MDLVAAETAIVQRLAAALPLVEVVAYPDEPDSYLPSHPVGTVLVVYRGADWTAPASSSAAASQEVVHTWEAVVLVRNLRSHAGAYPLLEGARRALQGWSVPGLGLGPGSLRQSRFQGLRAGVWQWSLLAAWRGVSVPDLDRGWDLLLPEPAPLLKTCDFEAQP